MPINSQVAVLNNSAKTVYYHDIKSLTVMDSSTIGTTAFGNTTIDGNGWIVKAVIDNTTPQGNGVYSKITLFVESQGYNSSCASVPYYRTVTGTVALRYPLLGGQQNATSSNAFGLWTSGATYVNGDYVYNKNGAASNSTRVYKCTNSGGTAANGPIHTSGATTGGDGIQWTWQSDTGQSSSPPKKYIEEQIGNDTVVYYVLDKYIHAGDRIIGVSVGAGAYGTNNVGRPSAMTITNNSTRAYFKPHVVNGLMPWTFVTNNILHVELYADHPAGQQNRTLAAVRFTVYDDTNTQVSTGLVTPAVVTSMVQSTNWTTTYGNAVPVYSADIDISGLTDGTTYSVGIEAFPFYGAKYDSGTDGWGPTGTWSTTTKATANQPKRIPFTKYASATINYAVVDGGAGTGAAVATSAATAATTPYGTIFAAAAALATANSGVLNGFTVCYIRANGSTLSLTGMGGDISTKTFGKSWFTIARYPGDTGTVTITPDLSVANNRKSGFRTKWSGAISFAATSSLPVLDNVNTSGVLDFPHETWFDGCTITGNGAQQATSRMGLTWATNCTLVGQSIIASNTRSGNSLAAGCTISGSAFPSVNHIGNKFVSAASLGAVTTSSWNENSQLIDTQMAAFNTFYADTVNIACFTQTNTGGGSWVCNLIEGTQTAAKGGQLSADGVTVATGPIYNMWNTSAGDGQNFCYNESLTAYVAKIGISKFNVFIDRNAKSDWWDNASSSSSNPNRTGNWPVRHGVDWEYNLVYNATFSTPSASCLSGDYFEATASFPASAGAIQWTANKSKTGDSTGNGDYRPTSSSSAKNMVPNTPVNRQMFPFDLNGTTRRTDGTGANGAFEWA
jgi:hypothetical protein